MRTKGHVVLGDLFGRRGGGVPGSQSDLGAVVLELAGKHPTI